MCRYEWTPRDPRTGMHYNVMDGQVLFSVLGCVRVCVCVITLSKIIRPNDAQEPRESEFRRLSSPRLYLRLYFVYPLSFIYCYIETRPRHHPNNNYAQSWQERAAET